MNAINTASVTNIDTRDEITLWGLLVWSYKNQMVRLSQPTDMDKYVLNEFGTYSMTSVVCNRLELGLVGGYGTSHVNTSSAHDDANIVHSVLLYGLKPYDARFMIGYAEKNIIPDSNIIVPLGKLVADRKVNGEPKMIRCPIKRRSVACKLYVDGYSYEEREALQNEARLNYTRWYDLLVILYNKLNKQNNLKKWKITTIGVSHKPWEENNKKIFTGAVDIAQKA